MTKCDVILSEQYVFVAVNVNVVLSLVRISIEGNILLQLARLCIYCKILSVHLRLNTHLLFPVYIQPKLLRYLSLLEHIVSVIY